MAASLERGNSRLDWGGGRDKDGHRSFWMTQLVYTSSTDDGPATVMSAPGLPTIGTYWSQGNDIDFWAICRPERTVRRYKAKAGEKHNRWEVRSLFSTAPFDRCQDEEIEDPLLEPDRISGGFTRYSETVTEDRNGNKLETVSHEKLPAEDREFDRNRPSVVISQNVSSLGLGTFAAMIDTVNDDTLWGMATRKIKLSDVSWERKVLGSCDYYYTRAFTFDVDDRGFDKKTEHVGMNCLGKWVSNGGTPPTITWSIPASYDKTNPSHFDPFVGKHSGIPTGKPMWLDPATGGILEDPDDKAFIDIEHYEESNFLTLGIPTVL